MKYSKLMKERVRRTGVLFRELGYEIVEGETSGDTFSAGFEDSEGFEAELFIDDRSTFLEIGVTFSFSTALSDFVRSQVGIILDATSRYGCYVNLEVEGDEIALGVFTKLHFAGLNYDSLAETVRDFRDAASELSGHFDELFDIVE